MLLDIRNLTKSYRLQKEIIPVLRDVNLTVQKGSYVSIMGPSGSGKSTLLNILGCLDSPTTGEYYLRGKPVHDCDLNQLAEVRNRSIGFIFQSFNLLPRLTLEQNVELPLIYASIPKSRRRTLVKEMLGRLGLWERRGHRPHEISGGQKQRTAIARALVKSPDFILADEPTGNLDSETTLEILALFKTLHAEGNTIVLITHDHAVSAQTERVYSIKDGMLSLQTKTHAVA